MKFLVCGGFGSLGRRVVQLLLEDGAEVIVIDKLKPLGLFDCFPNFEFRLIDALDEKHLADYFSSLEKFPDVIVNLAGLIHSEPIVSFKNDELVTHSKTKWSEVLNTNITGAFILLKATASEIINRGNRGVIINVSSVCAAGNRGQAAYSAAKSGIEALTVVAAKELTLMGIRTACIAPGFMDTESTMKALSESELRLVKSQIPSRQLGDPIDIYKAIKFIVDTDYVNGVTIRLDGGVRI